MVEKMGSKSDVTCPRSYSKVWQAAENLQSKQVFQGREGTAKVRAVSWEVGWHMALLLR